VRFLLCPVVPERRIGAQNHPPCVFTEPKPIDSTYAVTSMRA
jgi:hypothetical protein